MEPYFLPDSYGYRPGKSAIDAVAVTRQRCWRFNWLLEFDIKGLFDNIDHDLLMRAVKTHTDCKWLLLYIERWLKAPVQLQDGQKLHTRCQQQSCKGHAQQDTKLANPSETGQVDQ